MKTKKLFGISIITIAFALQIHAQSFLTTGLVAYYPFEGNANDASGTGNNGIVNGAALDTNAFGVANAAYSFNGNGQFILISNSPSLNTGNQLTLGVWINFSPGGTYNPRVISKNGVNGYELVTLGTSDQRQIGFYADGNAYINTAQFVNAGEWVYLTATYDGSQMCLYVNGVLDTSMAAACVFSNATDLTIGQNSQNSLDNYQGSLSDVRIYNRALSPSEISQLYISESLKPPFLNLAIGLTLYQQNTSIDNGVTTITAAPKALKYTTHDILNILAADKHLQGYWPANSFPNAAKLVTDGNHFVVINGTNILVNVSDIINIDFGSNEITSGRQNNATGLASNTENKLQILKIAFDDSQVLGGRNLKFYLQGALNQSTTDITLKTGNFKEIIKGTMSNGTGEGVLGNVNFICIGSVAVAGTAEF